MPLASSPRAIFFDLDGTLVDRELGASRWLQAQFDNFGNPSDFAAFYTQFQELDARGYTSKLETFAALTDAWKWPSTPEEIWADYRRNVERYCELFPDVLITLSALREAGFKLAIITNGTVECQQGKIDALGLDALVNAVIISEREGVKKPVAELFWKVCKAVGEEPQDCLMVGDSFEADVEGALNAGLQAMLLSRESAAKAGVAGRVIRSLEELLSWYRS